MPAKTPRIVKTRPIDRYRKATEIVAPDNRLIFIVHAIPGDDGCQPIVRYLTRKYQALAVNGEKVCQGRPVRRLLGVKGETFIAEYPYPYNASMVCDALEIPPHFVTHTILLLPGNEGMFDLSTDLSEHIDRIIFENQPTAFGIGDLHKWNPVAKNARTFEELPTESRRLINFIESQQERTVLYLGTGDYVIDREPVGERK